MGDLTQAILFVGLCNMLSFLCIGQLSLSGHLGVV